MQEGHLLKLALIYNNTHGMYYISLINMVLSLDLAVLYQSLSIWNTLSLSSINKLGAKRRGTN